MEPPSWATLPQTAFLVARHGPAGGGAEPVTLPKGKSSWLFGRNTDVCDIGVPHATVSRIHARLDHCSGKLFLTDLGSVHGTFVNGSRIQSKSTVEISLGKDKLSFSDFPSTFTVDISGTGAVGSLAADYESSGDEAIADEKEEDSGQLQQGPSRGRDASPGNTKTHQSGGSRQRDGRGREYRDNARTDRSSHEKGRRRSPGGERDQRGKGRDRDRDRSRSRSRSRSPDRRRDRSRERWRSRESDRSRDRGRHLADQGNRSDEGRRSRTSRFNDAPAQPVQQPPVAQSPADLVKQMMAAPPGALGIRPAGGSGLTIDQKKKLLWGGKKAAPAEASPVVVAPGGGSYNRWETAHFASEEERSRFQKMMGVKGTVTQEVLAIEPGRNESEGVVLDGNKQSEVLRDLERQYVSGLRRKDGRTVGLGL